METVYILGPMRGIPFYNFEAFDTERTHLCLEGHTVFSPADIDRKFGFDAFNLPPDSDWNSIPAGLDLKEIIRRDIEAVQKCTAFVCLDGWEKSSGAKAEKALCDWLGLKDLTPKKIGGDTYEVGKGVGVKFDQGKPEMALMPFDALENISAVFTYGAKKYDADNWAHGMRWRRMASALLRHVSSWIIGEDKDKESGFDHLAHAGCCLLMLYALTIRNKGTDDRFKEIK
jgi:hypothetical protein